MIIMAIDFTLNFVQEGGFKTPILFENSDGLGMRYVGLICSARFCYY